MAYQILFLCFCCFLYNSHVVCFVYSAFCNVSPTYSAILNLHTSTCSCNTYKQHSVSSNEGPFECHQEACWISWTKWDARETEGHEKGPIRSHTQIKVGVYSAAWWIHTFWSHPWPLYPGTSCLQRHIPYNDNPPPHLWLMFDGDHQRLFLYRAII